MDNNIQIYDNLVSSEILEIIDEAMQQPIWKWGHYSNQDVSEYKFWSRLFCGGKRQKLSENDYKKFAYEWPEMHALWTICRDTIHAAHPGDHKLILNRAYCNGYTYGTGGNIHTDDGRFTILFYSTKDWDKTWRGETLFFDDNADIVQAVQYIPGRFVCFPAEMMHQAADVSKTCNELRTIVAFKCLVGTQDELILSGQEA